VRLPQDIEVMEREQHKKRGVQSMPADEARPLEEGERHPDENPARTEGEDDVGAGGGGADLEDGVHAAGAGGRVHREQVDAGGEACGEERIEGERSRVFHRCRHTSTSAA
jgi:hypothetical protein